MSVEFHAKHRGLLEKALEAFHWTYTEISPGVLELDGRGIILHLAKGTADVIVGAQGTLNGLKREYSLQALKRASRLQGWQLKHKLNRKGVLRR